MVFIHINMFIFLTMTSSAFSKIIFVNEKKNWTEARKTCVDVYDGYLATIDIKKATDRELLRSCMPSGDAWFGNYSVASPFMAIFGCFKILDVENDNVHKDINLTTPSAGACEEKCQTNYFAISNTSCKCLQSYKDTRISLNATHCYIRCDQHAFCGGDGYVNVYHSMRNKLGNSEDRDLMCMAYLCKTNHFNTTSPGAHYCKDSESFFCNNTKIRGSGKWLSTFEQCTTNGSYLARSNICQQESKTYWSGYFRSEHFIFDKDNIPEKPLHVTVLQVCDKNITLSDPTDPIQDIKMRFLCQTSKVIQTGDNATHCVLDRDQLTTSSTANKKKTVSETNNTPGPKSEKDQHTTQTAVNRSKLVNTESIGTDSDAAEGALFAGIAAGGGALALIVISIIVVMIYRSRRTAKPSRNIPTDLIDDKEGSIRRENSYTDTFRNDVNYTQVKGRNDSGANQGSGKAINIYNDTKEGTYDHLHQRGARGIDSEDTYAHASLHLEEMNVYDVTSHQRIEKDDNDDDYSKFEKPDGIYN